MAKSVTLESFGTNAVTGLGFRAQKVDLMYEYCDRTRSTEQILFKFKLAVLNLGRGKCTDWILGGILIILSG